MNTYSCSRCGYMEQKPKGHGPSPEYIFTCPRCENKSLKRTTPEKAIINAKKRQA